MADPQTVQLSDEERDEFLSTGGTGVVSFTSEADEPPHSLPVSYGYDATTGEFYFRLAVDENRGKHDAVEARRPLSFVTYADTDTGWKSVVATGRLDEVPESTLDADVAEAVRRVHIPLVEMFERPTREVAFQFYRLRPETVTGRKEAPHDG